MITVTIWHSVALDGQGHQTGMLDGYQPGDPVVRVFTYQAASAGSPPREPPIWRNMLSTPLAVLARWVHDPRAEARRTGAVLDP